jgi:hypothetical protein
LVTSRPIFTSPAAQAALPARRTQQSTAAESHADALNHLSLQTKIALGKVLTIVSCCNSYRFRGMDGGGGSAAAFQSPRYRFWA